MLVRRKIMNVTLFSSTKDRLPQLINFTIVFTICTGLVHSEAGSKDEPPKVPYNNANAIGSTAKPELLSYQQITQEFGTKYQPQQVSYQQHYQPKTQLQPALPYNHQAEPLLKNPYVLLGPHRNQPVAMVIIAQPAYVPLSMLQQGNVAQQILQYFQGQNSQARFHYIPTNHQPLYSAPYSSQAKPSQYSSYVPQPQEPTYQPPTTAAPVAQPLSSQTQFYPHEALPSPQALVSHHNHQHVAQHLDESTPSGRALDYQSNQQNVEFQPQQVEEVNDEHSPEINNLAQQAAKHFLVNGGLNSGSRTAPAIITGLELFSPEQQEKIKKQLSEHFGSPLKPLKLVGQGQKQNEEGVTNSRKYYQNNHRQSQKFVPSVQVQNGEIKQLGEEESDKS